ncbi:MAG: hypothetical protein LBS98_00745 [Coriobacteriales bacterium]|nr:hypothetical protein [Coriobacteriales bacterium]
MHTESGHTSHPHEHSHAHIHEHSHEHPCDNLHTHQHPVGQNETSALLGYLIEHNTQHTDELLTLAGDAQQNGLVEVAKRIEAGATLYRSGTEELVKAHALLRKATV